MQIKNIAFNQGDYRYSIEYFDGKAVRKISTNEEALNSFNLAVKTLEERIKDYLILDELFKVSIVKIKFGKNEDAASTISLDCWYELKTLSIKVKLPPVNKEEKMPDAEQVGANIALNEVRGEILRYLLGEKAQQQLPFDEEEKEQEEQFSYDDLVDADFLFGEA